MAKGRSPFQIVVESQEGALLSTENYIKLLRYDKLSFKFLAPVLHRRLPDTGLLFCEGVKIIVSLSRVAVYLWLVIGLIIFGKGLHLVSTPAFWSSDPRRARWEAAILVILGVVMFFVAKLLFFKAVPKR